MLLQNKKDINQYFHDVWSETIIHWDGKDFSIDGVDEWVRIKTEARRISASGLSNVESSISSVARFGIFARTEYRSLELSDMIIALFSNNKIGLSFTIDTMILGTGKTDDGLYYFADLEVTLNTF